MPASGVRRPLDARLFQILPNSVIVGLKYTASVRVSSKKDSNLFNMASVILIVKSQPIVAMIDNGEREKTVSAEENLLVTGKRSHDPDDNKVLSYAWYSQTLAILTMRGNGLHSSAASIDKKQLIPGTSHDLVLNVSGVSPATGISTWSITTMRVGVLSGDAPSVSLHIAGVSTTKVDAGKRLKIVASVLATRPNGRQANVISQWTNAGTTGFALGHDDMQDVLLTPASIERSAGAVATTTGVPSKFSTVIRPFAMASGQEYRFRLTSTSIYGSGFAEITVITNAAPTVGVLEVVPRAGTVLLTTFSLTAKLFVDDDLPLEYRFLVDSTYVPLFKYTTSNNKKTQLPLPEDMTKDGTLPLRVQVRDRFGATSQTDSFAIVRLPISLKNDTSVVTNLVKNATTDLIQFAKNGDPSVVIATMRGITSLLNVGGDTKEATTTEGGEGGYGKDKDSSDNTDNKQPEDKVQKLSNEEMKQRASAREALFKVLDAVGQSLEPTPDNLYLQASVARSLTSNIKEQNSATRKRAARFVVGIVTKQLDNVTRNVEANMANSLLATVGDVLRGVPRGKNGQEGEEEDEEEEVTGRKRRRSRTLLESSMAMERKDVYRNMIKGTNDLATASIVEAVPGEESAALGLHRGVRVAAGRFDSDSTLAAAARAGLSTNTTSSSNSWSLPTTSIAIQLDGDKNEVAAAAAGGTSDIRSITWPSSLAPFEAVAFRSSVQTVHLSSSTKPEKSLSLNGSSLLVTLEMMTRTDPRTQGCQTFNVETGEWSKQGMITTGWRSATNTSHGDSDTGRAAVAAGVIFCASSHLSDFAAIDSPIEMPEINEIHFASDFALLENYNPSNMQAVYVLIGMFLFFVSLCICASKWEAIKYERAKREFVFEGYKSGPEDFEGEGIPTDIQNSMFLLDASLALQEAAKMQMIQVRRRKNIHPLLHPGSTSKNSKKNCIAACIAACTTSKCSQRMARCLLSFFSKLKRFFNTFFNHLLEEHSFVSILTVPDAHPFTSVQRLWVVWIMTLTNFAVIGMFFGRDPVNLYARINMAIISSIIMLPPSLFFSGMFLSINKFTGHEGVPGSHKAMRAKMRMKKLKSKLAGATKENQKICKRIFCCCRATEKIAPQHTIFHKSSTNSNERWAKDVQSNFEGVARSKSLSVLKGKDEFPSQEQEPFVAPSWAPERKKTEEIREAVKLELEERKERKMDEVKKEMKTDDDKEEEHDTNTTLGFENVAALKVREEKLVRAFSIRQKGAQPVIFSPSDSEEEEENENEHIEVLATIALEESPRPLPSPDVKDFKMVQLVNADIENVSEEKISSPSPIKRTQTSQKRGSYFGLYNQKKGEGGGGVNEDIENVSGEGRQKISASSSLVPHPPLEAKKEPLLSSPSPLKKKQSHKLTGREILKWHVSQADLIGSTMNHTNFAFADSPVPAFDSQPSFPSAQQHRLKILPRSGTIHLGATTNIAELRGKRGTNTQIQVTRCESKEERFARIRNDLKLLRFFSVSVNLVSIVISCHLIYAIASSSFFGDRGIMYVGLFASYVACSSMIGIIGAYLCYRMLLTVHAFASGSIVIFLACVAVAASQVEFVHNLKNNVVQSNLTNATSATTTTTTLFSVPLSTFLSKELEAGYQAYPIQVETATGCCGYLIPRPDCNLDFNSTDMNDVTNETTTTGQPTNTCSSVVINMLVEHLNTGDDVGYILFLFFFDIVLATSLVAGANKNKYNFNLDALVVIRKLEARISGDETSMEALHMIQTFYRRWKGKQIARRRMYYLLWSKHSAKRKVMSLGVYTLGILYSAMMIFIILIYGIKFETEIVVEWLTICCWSTLLDIFVQEPLSVMFATFVGQFDLGCFGDALFEFLCCNL